MINSWLQKNLHFNEHNFKLLNFKCKFKIQKIDEKRYKIRKSKSLNWIKGKNLHLNEHNFKLF